MKNTFLIILFLPFMISVASTQEKGMWLGGTLSLSGQGNGQTETRTSIMPELGYNLEGAWAVGARVGFTTEKSVLQGNTRRDNTTSIIPFARYTFGEVAGFEVFGQGELPIHFLGGHHYDGTTMDTSSSFGFRARPGVAYHFDERWGFNMLMPSVLNFVNNSGGTSSYRLGINDGYTIQEYLLSTSIGFIYKF